MESITLYPQRPSEQILKKYKEKLEYYLSAYGFIVDIFLRDVPHCISVGINGKGHETTCYWIDKIHVKNNSGESFEVKLFRDGFSEENTRNEDMWLDAFMIQDTYSNRLGHHPKISDRENPYWRLWDKKEFD